MYMKTIPPNMNGNTHETCDLVSCQKYNGRGFIKSIKECLLDFHFPPENMKFQQHLETRGYFQNKYKRMNFPIFI